MVSEEAGLHPVYLTFVVSALFACLCCPTSRGSWQAALPGGRPAGFPLVMETNVGRGRAAELWAAVAEGAFLDPATTSLRADLLSYNPRLQLFGSTHAAFRWTPGGRIEVTVAPATAMPAYPPLSTGHLSPSLYLMLALVVVFVGTVAWRTGGAWLAAAVRAMLAAREALLGLHEDNARRSRLSSRVSAFPGDGLARVPDVAGSAFDGRNPYSRASSGAKRGSTSAEFVPLVRASSAYSASSPFLARHAHLSGADMLDTAIASAMLLAAAFFVAAIATAGGVTPLSRYTIYDAPQMALARYVTLPLPTGTPSPSSVDLSVNGLPA